MKISIDGVGGLPPVDAHAGGNRQSFKKVKGKSLKPGGYRATIVARANGLKSKLRHVNFTVN